MGRRSGACSRGSKKSILFYTTDCGDDKEDIGLKFQQRSVSLTALHTGVGSQPQYIEPRMAQLETLEAKMANIEVSLSTTPRRKKGGSISGGMTSPAGHRNKDQYKEVDALRVALRDKENIIQTLKGQLCNTYSNRISSRNGSAPLTEADKKITEDRLQRLKRDSDNKRLTIKNLKFALERLDITDNIDIKIQQAELEYRLGREELELLTLREESRALQAALELAETQEKQKNCTIFSCVSDTTQMTIHAVEISADPKSPRFGAGPKDDAAGIYVDWAVEDSGLCKGDRILEVNGKLVVGAGRNDFARLLAVTPEAAQIIVLRKSESLAALRTLRSDNLRLTHRIGYLEEQVRDLLSQPLRTEKPVVPIVESPIRKDNNNHLQVFQKGPQVTALVGNLPGLNARSSCDLRQSISSGINNRQSEHSKRLNDMRDKYNREQDITDGTSSLQYKPRSKDKLSPGFQLTRSTASLDIKTQNNTHRRRSSKFDTAIDHFNNKNRKSTNALQSLEFDSEPTYYRMQDNQSRASEQSEISINSYNTQERKTRPTPPKKPLRLSLHRTASLQSVENAPPPTSQQQQQQQQIETPRKPAKRNYRGDLSLNGRLDNDMTYQTNDHPPLPPPRTPSRAESCQSALRWPSPKPRPHLASVTIDKWC
ncbi:hypothetical protein HCN44_007301 [Aphidius gifuensis]|uniref:PDZ domain-containing protein n=1 Tax=Aphidius gifuensis TaxID=684658 RepID=A0A834XLN8_APHGI|nr:uncharacterized protein LOC122857142 [Aphidius gifuensis]KAF7988991.1 hypothetical protein HCN44_007301 [Aphidius gifuensis]